MKIETNRWKVSLISIIASAAMIAIALLVKGV